MSDWMFVVWAYRYGNTKDYNFPVGIFNKLDDAEEAAHKHKRFRGGKYSHRIYSLQVGKQYDAEEAFLVGSGFIDAGGGFINGDDVED